MYERMYYHLFNAISEALESLRQGDVQEACERLERAQQETEEAYMEGDGN